MGLEGIAALAGWIYLFFGVLALVERRYVRESVMIYGVAFDVGTFILGGLACAGTYFFFPRVIALFTLCVCAGTAMLEWHAAITLRGEIAAKEAKRPAPQVIVVETVSARSKATAVGGDNPSA